MCNRLGPQHSDTERNRGRRARGLSLREQGSKMNFDVSILKELAQTQKVPEGTVIRVVEKALGDAYAKSSNPVEGAVVKLDEQKNRLIIEAPDGTDVTPADFGRMAAMTMRQAVQMWLKDLERRRKLGAWADKENTLVTGTVRAHAARNARGETIIDLGNGVEAVMPSGEATPQEVLKHGQEVVVYVVAVNPDERGRIKVTVSRRQPNLVAELVRQQVPEVADGRIEIIGVAREPGVRAKIGVRASANFKGDVAEAVFGAAAYRIRAVAAKLGGGEKLDVVVDPGTIEGFVANALTPAKVTTVQMDENSPHPHALVGVPRDQVTLAIGAEGRNTRLASKLTGVKIDVLVDED